jgi:alkylation response protein AidB-like acyl-CoA dehydrogenase
MDFEFGERADALRAELRALIAEEIPVGFLGAFTDDPADLAIAQRFCARLASEHLLTLAWPEEYGGRDASVWEQTVVREEMWAHHEPRGAQYMGVNWVGPALMAFGTDEQKARHLPAISAGTVIWCQGFSEPDAGSDLAALTTRAIAVDGGWTITGQKIWTSYAGMAQWCVLAARVGVGEHKHDGITLFLVPMDTPGITVTPIASSLGNHHLNEVFLADVVVDDRAVLGGVGNGWQVMRHALSFERVGIARYARCDRLLSELEAELDTQFDALPGSVRAAWTRALVAVRVARLLNYRAIHLQSTGAPADTAASMARIAVTTTDQLVADALFPAPDASSLRDGARGAELHGAVEDHSRYAQAATVASGTIEIQRMIVGRAVLGRDTGVRERTAGT